MPRTRNPHPPEFREQLVALAHAGRSVEDLAREFELEEVRFVKDRGVAVTKAARDPDLRENVLRKWVHETSTDPQHAFPGHEQMKPEQLEIDRRRKEVAELKASRHLNKGRSLLRE